MSAVIPTGTGLCGGHALEGQGTLSLAGTWASRRRVSIACSWSALDAIPGTQLNSHSHAPPHGVMASFLHLQHARETLGNACVVDCRHCNARLLITKLTVLAEVGPVQIAVGVLLAAVHLDVHDVSPVLHRGGAEQRDEARAQISKVHRVVHTVEDQAQIASRRGGATGTLLCVGRAGNDQANTQFQSAANVALLCSRVQSAGRHSS